MFPNSREILGVPNKVLMFETSQKLEYLMDLNESSTDLQQKTEEFL